MKSLSVLVSRVVAVFSANTTSVNFNKLIEQLLTFITLTSYLTANSQHLKSRMCGWRLMIDMKSLISL